MIYRDLLYQWLYHVGQREAQREKKENIIYAGSGYIEPEYRENYTAHRHVMTLDRLRQDIGAVYFFMVGYFFDIPISVILKLVYLS